MKHGVISGIIKQKHFRQKFQKFAFSFSMFQVFKESGTSAKIVKTK